MMAMSRTQRATRPAGLPSARSFAHGTRSRYVSGCRCSDCKRANVAYYHHRQAAKKDAAPSVTPSGPPGAGVLLRAGIKHHVRTCPGANGAPCVRSPAAWLRGQHDVCGACVERATVWNGNVAAASVRAHLAQLSRAGVGRNAVSAASDVPRSILAAVLAGRKTKLRQRTARRILGITAEALSDHALVPAGPTWKLIGALLDEGFTKGEIARRLGRKTPALQLRRDHVLAVTALRVRRLHDAIMMPELGELPRGYHCGHCGGEGHNRRACPKLAALGGSHG